MKKIIIGFILGGIVFTLGGVVATTAISSSQVTYQNKTVGNALDKLYNNAVDGKEVIAAAITNKGISTTSTDTYDVMATNINSIDTDHTELNQKISSLESKHTSDIASISGSISNISQDLSQRLKIVEHKVINIGNVIAGSLYSVVNNFVQIYGSNAIPILIRANGYNSYDFACIPMIINNKDLYIQPSITQNSLYVELIVISY